eukprot:SAG11_NODE_11260_length_773_cov_1.062315_1_plen_226_part_01
MKLKKVSLRDLVRRIDTDNSGSVSVPEFARGILGVAPDDFSKEDAFDLAHATDTKSQGTIDMAAVSQKLGDVPLEGLFATDVGLKTIRDRFLASRSAEEIKLAFQRFDADGSGTISPDELARGAKSLGVTLSRQQIDHIFAECDEDGDGELDFDEFVTRVLKQEPLPGDKIENIKRQLQLTVFDLNINYQNLFDRWDISKSGYLSLRQFGDGMASLPRFSKVTRHV